MAKKRNNRRSGWASSEWRKQVLARDNYTCQNCDMKSVIPGFLDVDHIKAVKDFPDLKYSVLNGRTLCPNCHKMISLVMGHFYSKK